MGSNLLWLGTYQIHPGEGPNFGVDMQKTSANSATGLTTTVYSVTETASTNVTTALTITTASTSGTINYTGKITGWTDETKYQVELAFTLAGNDMVAIWEVLANDNRP